MDCFEMGGRRKLKLAQYLKIIMKIKADRSILYENNDQRETLNAKRYSQNAYER